MQTSTPLPHLAPESAATPAGDSARSPSDWRYRRIVEAAHEGIWEVDEASRTTYVNPRMTEILGYPAEEILGRPVSDFVSESSRGDVERQLERVRAGAVQTYERSYRRKDGTEVATLITTNPIYCEDGSFAGAVALVTNLTPLRRMEGIFEATFRRNPCPMVLRALPSRRIVDVNEAFERTLGYRREEVVGQAAIGLTAAAGTKDGQEIAALMRSGSPFADVAVEVATRQGRFRQGLLSAEIIEAGGERYLLTTFNDVTALREAEASLRQQESRLAEIVEGLRAGTWEWNVESGETAFNERWAEIVGYTRSELAPVSIETWNALVHPEDRRRSEALLRRHFAGELEFYDCECRMRHKSGRWVWVHDRGRVVSRTSEGHPLKMAGTHVDITSRKRMEEAVRTSERRFREVLENSLDAHYKRDLATDSYQYLSPVFDRISGYGPEEMANLPIGAVLDLIHPDDAAEIARSVRRAVSGPPGTPCEVEYRFRHKDGEYRWLRDRFVAVCDEKDEPTALIGSVSDITDHKLAEEELRALRLELERRAQERGIALDEANRELIAYSFSIAHEVRAPLRAIDGFTALATDRLEPQLDEETRHFLSEVRWNSQRMGKLVDDLLAFSQAGRARLEIAEVDMTAAARAAFGAALAPRRADPGAIELELDELPPVHGDAGLLDSVWKSLLSNAVKYSAGRLRPEIRISGEVVGQEAIYRVRDNGVGFDMRFAGKLFGIFDRLVGQREFAGTGVGLALVKRIVERHGGRVWAEGVPDGGATFSFSLPVRA